NSGGSQPPPARAYGAAAYDPVRGRMLELGGLLEGGGYSPVTSDVYALTLAPGSEIWAPLSGVTGDAPPARYGHTAIYDPVGDQMIVSGGFGSPGDTLADAWALKLSGPGSPSWSQLPSNPFAKQGYHSAVYDPVNQRMIT